MSTLPNFTGPGYFAGEAPDGLTTVAGVPVSADVRVYWRDPTDPAAADVPVAQTISAADGTWRITGLNPELQYVVRGRKAGYDDVTVVGRYPTRTDVITYEGEFTNNEDFDGAAGEILITSGLPPFTASVIEPLPYGLAPMVIDGRKLIIDGTSDDEGVWDSVVRVTASNGVFADVPVQAVIGLKAPDITVRYAAAGDWTITLQLAGGSEFAEVLRVYRSTEPLDLEALPEHVAELDADAEQWVDADVEPGQTYYYAVGAYVGGAVAMSAAVEREAVWTPDDLPQVPQIWLDWESSITPSSGVVSAWANRGSAGGTFTQSVSAARPTVLEDAIEGKRAIRFDGANDALVLSSGAGLNVFRSVTKAWSFAVYKKRGEDPSPTNRTVFVARTSSDTFRFGIAAGGVQTNAHNRPSAGGRRLDGDSYAGINGTVQRHGTWSLMMGVGDYSARTLRLFIDGAQNTQNTSWLTSGGTSNTASGALVVGSNSAVGGTADAADIDLACVIAGNSAISDDDIARLHGWAAHQLGLTDQLPAGHPYKSVAP